MRTHAPAVGLVALVTSALLLAGCGEEGGTEADDAASSASPSETSTESAEPAATAPQPQCDDVWVTGTTLPADYAMCFDGEEQVDPDGVYCEVGTPLVTHESHWWAVRGGEVQEATTDGPLVEDPGYQADLRPCRG